MLCRHQQTPANCRTSPELFKCLALRLFHPQMQMDRILSDIGVMERKPYVKLTCSLSEAFPAPLSPLLVLLVVRVVPAVN